MTTHDSVLPARRTALAAGAAADRRGGRRRPGRAGPPAARPRTPGSGGTWFQPGNLVVSGSDYTGTASLFTPGVTELPPGCPGSACTPAGPTAPIPACSTTTLPDPSFGVTSPIFLDQLTPDGHLVNTLRVPDGTGLPGGAAGHVVTSFSSKSELALNLSTSGRDLTFMGYDAVPDTVDVSNANTPCDIDPTNPVAGAYYRVVAEVNQDGRFSTRYQRLQRRQRPGGDPERLRRRERPLRGGERRERGQPAAGRHHHRCRRADPDPAVRCLRRPSSPASRRRWAASASPSSATRPTRSARTPTSAA